MPFNFFNPGSNRGNTTNTKCFKNLELFNGIVRATSTNFTSESDISNDRIDHSLEVEGLVLKPNIIPGSPDRAENVSEGSQEHLSSTGRPILREDSKHILNTSVREMEIHEISKPVPNSRNLRAVEEEMVTVLFSSHTEIANTDSDATSKL